MATNSNGVLLKNVVADFRLQVAYASTDYDRVTVCVEEVTRPGLPLAGFFDHFESQRIQVIGNVEYTFIQNQTHERLLEVFGKICEAKIPAIIFARSMEPTPECLEMAKKYDVTVLCCMEATSYMVSSLITYLKNALAPQMTRHGVLVEVYGEGLLLMGESGIGKSETAAELLKRGHRLIADDAVRIRRIANNTLMGDAPELIQNYIEIRGIGVINVAKLYGMASVKKETAVDLVINIVPWSDEQDFDRLGLEDQCVDLLGVKIPSITVPVKPGRNLSIILEIAAMNNRQKKMGYNSAKEFTERLDRHFTENNGQTF